MFRTHEHMEVYLSVLNVVLLFYFDSSRAAWRDFQQRICFISVPGSQLSMLLMSPTWNDFCSFKNWAQGFRLPAVYTADRIACSEDSVSCNTLGSILHPVQRRYTSGIGGIVILHWHSCNFCHVCKIATCAWSVRLRSKNEDKTRAWPGTLCILCSVH